MTQPPPAPAVPDIKGPFAVSLSIQVPERIVRTSASRPPLPYATYFDGLEEVAQAGRSPHFFVPCSFYKGRPGVKIENVDPSYVRTKVREFFKKWQGEKPGREPLYVTIVNRDGKDEGSIAMAEALKIEVEPGVSVWVLKATAE